MFTREECSMLYVALLESYTRLNEQLLNYLSLYENSKKLNLEALSDSIYTDILSVRVRLQNTEKLLSKCYKYSRKGGSTYDKTKNGS